MLRGLLIAAALLFGASAVRACSFSDWSSTAGTPVSADPNTGLAGFARYSTPCAIQTDAIGDQVIDTKPTNESTYNVRFYYYTGQRSGGSANIFQARGTTGVTNIPVVVQHDATNGGPGASTNLVFAVHGSPQTRTVAVVNNRWYAIQLKWVAGAGTGLLNIKVTGAGSDTPLTPPAITAINNGSDRIEEARLGLISGAGTGSVNFDAFESRRQTEPARLCRGDANHDGVIGVADRVMITNEILGISLAPGEPDANEDGGVGAADRVVVTNMILAGQTCNGI